MTENDQSSLFDDVALQYARHYANLALARRRFEEQRDHVLVRVSEHVAKAAADLARPVQKAVLEDELGMWGYSTYLEGKMFAARSERMQRDNLYGDGFWVGFGTGEEVESGEPLFALRSHIFFLLRRSTYVHLRPAFSRLAEQLNATHMHAGYWARLVLAPVVLEECNAAAIDRVIADLVDGFATADDALAVEYRRVWSMPEITA